MTTFEELLSEVTHGLSNAVERPNAYGYIPHPKQVPFHKSPKRIRMYCGGNRSGKTTAGIVEDVRYLLDDHPYRPKRNHPIRGRLVTTDFKNGLSKIIVPKLQQYVPRSQLIDGDWDKSFNMNTAVLRLANGSSMDIMSTEQPVMKFGGVDLDFCHFDEEPPQTIYNECKIRLTDRRGDLWLTMTPTEGFSWTYDEIFLPGLETDNPLVDVIVVRMADNPYISSDEIAEGIAGAITDEEEYEIRVLGNYVPIGGLVFPEFDPEKHVVERANIPPKTWPWWGSIDVGLRNPTAAYMHAIAPDRTVVTFWEHFKAGFTVPQHARVIQAGQVEMGKDPRLWVADPSILQRDKGNGLSLQIQYRSEGLNLVPSDNKLDAGLNKMRDYIRTGRWLITKDCPNLIRELRRYKWENYDSPKMKDKKNLREQPQKKDDHAIDSSRYFFAFMPHLTPGTPVLRDAKMGNHQLHAFFGNQKPWTGYDTQLREGERTSEDYSGVANETLGEWW